MCISQSVNESDIQIHSSSNATKSPQCNFLILFATWVEKQRKETNRKTKKCNLKKKQTNPVERCIFYPN